MNNTVYVVRDTEMIENLINDEFNGFNALVEEGGIFDVEVVDFESESDALAFCASLETTLDEGNVSAYPLRSFESCDEKYITVLESVID